MLYLISYLSHRIIDSFSHKGPKGRANKPGINFIIFISIFVENYLLYDVIQDFPAWLRTGSDPADINWFRSYTENFFYKQSYKQWCVEEVW